MSILHGFYLQSKSLAVMIVLAALSAPAELCADSLMLDFGPTLASGTALTNSPGHTAGATVPGNVWNTLGNSDVTSGLLASDGSALPGVVVHLGGETGSSTKVIDFAVNPSHSNALGTSITAGIYASPSVGRDGIYYTVASDSRGIGLRIDGLAAGSYEIFATGRNTNNSANPDMNFHAAAGAAAGTFDFSTLPASAASNESTASWIANNNYARFVVAITAGQSIYVVSDGQLSGLEGRGFFNSVQVLPIAPPPPPPPPILASEGFPNILILFADDIGYETLGANGGLDFNTPRLDRMAAEGVRFSRAYSSPVCTPSRVSLHTGLYTTDHGHTDVLPVHLGQNVAVNFQLMPTFAQLVRARGYETSTTGKWQLATLFHRPNHIRDAGFDSWCVWQIWNGTAKTERHWDPYFNRDGSILTNISTRFGPDVLEEYVWERMTTAKAADKPFLILHNILLPHEPIIDTPRDRALSRPASLGNMVEYLDHLVGLTLDKIEDLGIRNNTYVFFIGDNGTDSPYFQNPQAGQAGQGPNTRHTTAGNVNGGKYDLNDAGSHVPFIVWGPPGLPAGKVVNDLIDITDIFPTICQLARTGIPQTIPYRGTSIVPAMHGRRGIQREWSHQGISGAFSVFDGKWRLRSDGTLIDAYALPTESVATPGPAADAARARLQPLLDGIPNPVPGATSALDTWRGRNFGALPLSPALEASVWGDLANPDSDRLPNLFEYLLGSNPNRADADDEISLTFDETGAPSFHTITRTDDLSHFAKPRISTNLTHWTIPETLFGAGETSAINRSFSEVFYQWPTETPVPPKMMFRLQAE